MSLFVSFFFHPQKKQKCFPFSPTTVSRNARNCGVLAYKLCQLTSFCPNVFSVKTKLRNLSRLICSLRQAWVRSNRKMIETKMCDQPNCVPPLYPQFHIYSNQFQVVCWLQGLFIDSFSDINVIKFETWFLSCIPNDISRQSPQHTGEINSIY